MLIKSPLGRTLLIICINVIIGVLFLVFTDWDHSSNLRRRGESASAFSSTIPSLDDPSSAISSVTSSLSHSIENATPLSSLAHSRTLPIGAYATLVTGADYVKPAVALVISLKETRTPFPMIALVTPDLSEANRTVLNKAGWDLIDVPPINNEFGTQTARFSGSKVMSKLWLWNLTNIAEKIAYIDADSLAMDNLDSIFDLCDNFCSPIDYVPHFAGGGYWYFNSGMMVLRPDLAVMQSLLSFAKDPLIPNWDHADMGLLNRFFYFDCQGAIKHPIETTSNGEIISALAAEFRSKPNSQHEYNPPSIPQKPITSSALRSIIRCQSLPLEYNLKGGTDPPLLEPIPKIIHFFDNQKAHLCLDKENAPYKFRTFLSKNPKFCETHPYVQLFMNYLRRADLLL